MAGMELSRRNIIRGAVALPLAAVLPTGGQMPDEMGAVTPDDIQRLRDDAGRLKALDMHSGAGAHGALRVAVREANAAQAMMTMGCASTLRRERAEAVAWFLCNTAFMAHDAKQEPLAKRLWFQADATAREAERHSLTARIRSQQARQSLALGEFQQTITLTQHAIDGDKLGELSATELAALYALMARGLASMNNPDFVAASRQADVYWHAQREDWDLHDRPWWSHFDIAHLLGDQAAAARVALEHGHRIASQTIGLYEEAALAQDPKNRRSKVMNLVDLSCIEIKEGDVEAGISVGFDAVELGHDVKSQRIADRFDAVLIALRPHAGVAGARDLVDAIRDVA